LLESEFKGLSEEGLKEVDVEAEITESNHGLAHLQASDEELQALLANIE